VRSRSRSLHAGRRRLPTSHSWWDEEGFWYGLHTLLDPVRIPFFREALRAQASEAPLVLDVGSGAGFVAVELGDQACMVAIDRSHPPLVEAQAAGVPAMAVADAARLPFPDATFDAVICSEVLEHVEDPAAVIAEAARVTAPGGLFLFSTPARTWWSRLVLITAAQRWRLTRVLPPDLHDWGAFLTPETVSDLLTGSGFRIRRISGIGVRARRWPAALGALSLLRLGRIGYAEAGRRISLTTIDSTRLAMIGCAERTT